MKQLLKILFTPAVLVGVLFMPSASVFAIDVCSGDNGSALYCQNKNEGETKVNSMINSVSRLLLMAVGVISVIAIVIGGILFATANGDSSKVSRARNTVLYAAVGLVVAIFASAIIDTVFNQVR